MTLVDVVPGRSHGPGLTPEDHKVPPVRDGEWTVVPILNSQRTTPVGVFEASALTRKTHVETGAVVYDVRTVAFMGGRPHETSRQMTPDELFSRLRGS